MKLNINTIQFIRDLHSEESIWDDLTMIVGDEDRRWRQREWDEAQEYLEKRVKAYLDEEFLPKDPEFYCEVDIADVVEAIAYGHVTQYSAPIVPLHQILDPQYPVEQSGKRKGIATYTRINGVHKIKSRESVGLKVIEPGSARLRARIERARQEMKKILPRAAVEVLNG